MKQKLFRHFPGVICVDTINQTNKDKYPLSTMSERDTHGKMFIILRAFLPNVRAVVFCCFFNGYTNLISFSCSISSNITDDCPQECIQIHIARKIILKYITDMIWVSPS